MPSDTLASRWAQRRPGETVAEFAERTGLDPRDVARGFYGVSRYRPPLTIEQLHDRHPRESEAKLLARFRENIVERYRAARVRNAMTRYHNTDDGANDPRSTKEVLAAWREMGIAVPRFKRLDAEGRLVNIPHGEWTPAERKFLTDVLRLTEGEIRSHYR